MGEVKDVTYRILRKALLFFEADASQGHLVDSLVLLDDLRLLLDLPLRDLVLGHYVHGCRGFTFFTILLENSLILHALGRWRARVLLAPLRCGVHGMCVFVGVGIGLGLSASFFLLLLLLLLGFARCFLSLLTGKLFCLKQAFLF